MANAPYTVMNVEVSAEQHEKLQDMVRKLEARKDIVRTMVVSAAPREMRQRVAVPTPGMVKVNWLDADCIETQAWVAADGEVVEVYWFIESMEDGTWVRLPGRAADFNFG